MTMDQKIWTRIYDDLDTDLAGAVTRSSSGPDLELFVDIDSARFAIDRGDHARAIELLESVRKRLDAGGVTRGGPAPSAAVMEELADEVLQDLRLGSARDEVVGEVVLPDEQVTRSGGSGAAKVNRSTKLDDIADEYVEMFESARITPDKAGKVRWYTDKLLSGREAYEEISEETKVPWYFVGLVHGMECGFSMQKHLHNGDSLKARTWQVPKGRPKEGAPPFAFVDSAVDALSYDKLTGRDDWDLARILYRLELYNGWGYRKSRGMATPYLWSFSNHHQRGKYVQDGKFDPNATSAQCGAAVMLRDLVERKIVSFKAEATPAPAPAVVTVPAPKPAVEAPPAPAPVAAAEAPAPAPAPKPAAEAPAPVPAAPAAAAAVAAAAAAAAVNEAVPPSPAPAAPAAGAASAAASPPPPPPAANGADAPAPAPATGNVVAAISALAAVAAATKPQQDDPPPPPETQGI